MNFPRKCKSAKFNIFDSTGILLIYRFQKINDSRLLIIFLNIPTVNTFRLEAIADNENLLMNDFHNPIREFYRF